jgi:hypothetical protein
MRSAWSLVVVVACAPACSSKPAADAHDQEEEVAPHPHGTGNGGPAIHAEIGALDEDEARKAYEAARPSIDRCITAASKRHKFVEGDFEAMLRIDGSGRVRWGYPTVSTFGDYELETCILDALREQQWPKPQGGEEGLTSQSLGFDPAGRAASKLGPDDLGDKLGELESALRQCRSSSGTKWLAVTFYVGPEGNVVSAGAAAGDEKGVEALSCAVDAAKGMTFPSPGSYAGKFTVRVD